MRLLGFLLQFFHNIAGSYGMAIILFTVFIKLLLLPLNIKQHKSLSKTQKIQPYLAQLQKKYGNDKEKLNQETMKLYSKYGINPMGGCLPTVVQLPIIMALYWVIKKPITYIIGVDASEIWRIIMAFSEWAEVYIANGGILNEALTTLTVENFGNYEIQVAQQMFLHPEILNHEYIASAGGALPHITPISFNFFGLDLSETPNLGALLGAIFGNISGITREVMLLWIIPLLSGLTSFLTSKFSPTSTNKKPDDGVIDPNKPKAPDTMKTMMYIMPLFSVWITFTLPAGVGLYWIVSNILSLAQQLVFNKYLTPKINLEPIEGEIIDVKKSRKKRKKS